jgi:hypothetical protein
VPRSSAAQTDATQRMVVDSSGRAIDQMTKAAAVEAPRWNTFERGDSPQYRVYSLERFVGGHHHSHSQLGQASDTTKLYVIETGLFERLRQRVAAPEITPTERKSPPGRRLPRSGRSHALH